MSRPEGEKVGFFDLGAAALRQLPAETAHNATLKLAGLAAPLIPRAPADDPRERNRHVVGGGSIRPQARELPP